MANIDKLIALAQEHLSDEETIHAVVEGVRYTKPYAEGIFIATDQRLVFFIQIISAFLKSFKVRSFDYSNISSIEMSSV